MEQIPVYVTIAVFVMFLLAMGYIICVQSIPIRQRFHYLFFARFQLLVILVIIGFAWFAKNFAPSLIANLFVLNSRREIVFATFFAIIAAKVGYITTETIVLAAPSFGQVEPLTRPSGYFGRFLSSSLFFSFAAIPFITTVYIDSTIEPLNRLSAIATGCVLAMFVGAAHWYVTRRLVGLNQKDKDKGLFKLLEQPPFGIFTPAYAHVRAFLYCVLTLILYFAGFFAPLYQSPSLHLPALLYLILLLILFTWVIAFSAFFFDRWRVPVLLVGIALLFALWRFADRDSYYPLQPKYTTEDARHTTVAEQGTSNLAEDGCPISIESSGKEMTGSQSLSSTVETKPLTAQIALGHWLDTHEDDGLPMVVIMTSGGGIKASLWTINILRALQVWLGDEFADHVVLISSVSGGSVGVLHYMDAYVPLEADQGVSLPTYDTLENAAQKARIGGLADAAWALSYHDLWQNVFGDPLKNRGWALERAWQRTLNHPCATIEEWKVDVLKGQRPPVLFNSTSLDKGGIFVFSPLDYEVPTNEAVQWHSVYFSTVYTNATVYASTAVRMSATFPYISPISRAKFGDNQIPTGYYLADGGYFDNDGAVSALEWLDATKETRDLKGQMRKILLVRIESSEKMPEFPTLDVEVNDDLKNITLLASIAGPPLGALNTLFTAQKWRNDLAIEQLHLAPQVRKTDLTEQAVQVKQEDQIAQVSQASQTSPVEQTGVYTSALDKLSYTFVYSGAASLSWQLSSAEMISISDAITNPANFLEALNLCDAFYQDFSACIARCAAFKAAWLTNKDLWLANDEKFGCQLEKRITIPRARKGGN